MRKDYNLEKRRYVIGGFIVLITLIYICRLVSLQVLDSKYKEYADSNAFLRKAVYPSRGIIYDRDGRLIVDHQPSVTIIYKTARRIDSFTQECIRVGIFLVL